MSETISEIPIQIEVSEEVRKQLARQALIDTVPPYDDDKYGMLVEL